MNPEEDAFGQSLLAFHNGSICYQVVERDDGFVDVMEVGAYFSTFEEWRARVINIKYQG